MLTLFGLKTCDTCRKAAKSLESTGKSVVFRDVRSEPLTEEALEGFLLVFGDKLLNTRSTTWRGLSDQERNRPVLQLLKEYPALMKRPILSDGERSTIGWDKSVQAHHLG